MSASVIETVEWSPREPGTPRLLAPWPDAPAADVAEARRAWLLRGNPAGARLWLARRDGRTVAASAAVPVRTRVRGEPRVFAQLLGGEEAGMDREAWLAAARALQAAHATPEGDLVHYAWEPEAEPGVAQRELGYELLNVTALLGRAPGPGPDAPPPDVETVTAPDAAFDHLYACCATHWNASAIRDAAWLRWRFLENPLRDYRVLALRWQDVVRGYAVYRSAPDVRPGLGLLVDWLVLPGDEEASEKLLAATLAAARADGAGVLAGAFPEWSPWSLWFQERGFLHRPGSWACLVRGSVGRIDMLWLRDAWWVTLGDVLFL